MAVNKTWNYVDDDGLEHATYKVDTAGLGGENTMTFGVGKWSCGDIKDGIGIDICNMRGGWVISKADFLEIARLIQEFDKQYEKINAS